MIIYNFNKIMINYRKKLDYKMEKLSIIKTFKIKNIRIKYNYEIYRQNY